MRERDYQAKLIKKLKKLFPGCVILKNDPEYIQGIPDLLILHEDKWAMLEVKISATANTQPNQQYYVDTFNRMSYAAFINPSNEKDILDAIQRSFATKSGTRVPQP